MILRHVLQLKLCPALVSWLTATVLSLSAFAQDVPADPDSVKDAAATAEAPREQVQPSAVIAAPDRPNTSAATWTAGFDAFKSSQVANVVKARRSVCDRSEKEWDAREKEWDASEKARGEREKARFAVREASATNVAAGTQSATTANRLAAAIGTDVEGDGVKAGVEVAPLALAQVGPPDLTWTVQVAALEEGKARIGTGVAWLFSSPIDLEKIVNETACSPSWEKDTKKQAAALLNDAEEPFRVLCDEVVTASSTYRKQLDSTCALTESGKNLAARLVRLLRNEFEGADEKRDESNRRFRESYRGHASYLETLEDVVNRLTRLSVGYSEESFLPQYRSELYKKPTLRLGLDGSADFDTLSFGRARQTINNGQVIDETLPSGDLLAWKVGVSANLRFARFGAELQGKFGPTQPTGDDVLRNAVLFGGDLNCVLTYFLKKSESLSSKLEAGNKLPPRMVLGFKGQAEVALEKADFQKSNFNDVEAMPYLDFVLSDNLSFRLGIPLRGRLVEQEAQTDDTTGASVPKRTDLQWTVPITIATAISM